MATLKGALQIFEWFGFVVLNETETEANGTCPFCSKSGKFYVNKDTRQWSCKGGGCMLEGNVYTFIQTVYVNALSATTAEHYQALADDRKMQAYLLEEAQLAYYAKRNQWIIPVRNAHGSICNLWVYKRDEPVMGMPGLPANIYGLEKLAEAEGHEDVYICEGAFDSIAKLAILRQAGAEHKSIVVGVPGAGTFKDEWTAHFSGKYVILCYDADEAGRKGVKRAGNRLHDVTKSTAYLTWAGFPEKYDIRDAYIDGMPLSAFQYITARYAPDSPNEKNGASDGSVHEPDTLRRNKAADKPPFQKVLDAYAKHLYLTPDYELAIRVAYATVLSEYIPGDPLWVYLVAPPSTGKTVILLSFSTCLRNCFPISTVSPNALVSGWRTQDGRDPSIIPKLNGKTLILKDVTEILEANRDTRDSIYSILRGAYDGTVERAYGNGITRKYTDVHFSLLAGVTQKVYAERSASLGERFLMLHVVKGNDHANAEDIIMRALQNVGEDTTIADELQAAASEYITYGLSEEELEEAYESCGNEFNIRIASLAQLVGMLRGQVDKDVRGEALLYRPQYEMGARLAKQLKKMAISLALLETPIGVTESIYRNIVRIAFDTCIGFNLEIVQALTTIDRLDLLKLNAITGIPATTLRGRLEDMCDLEILCRYKLKTHERGRPLFEYALSPKAHGLWKRAGLSSGFAPENPDLRTPDVG